MALKILVKKSIFIAMRFLSHRGTILKQLNPKECLEVLGCRTYIVLAVVMLLSPIHGQAQNYRAKHDVYLGVGANHLVSLNYSYPNAELHLPSNWYGSIGYRHSNNSIIELSSSYFYSFFNSPMERNDGSLVLRMIHLTSLVNKYVFSSSNKMELAGYLGVAYRDGFEIYDFKDISGHRREFAPDYSNIAINIGSSAEFIATKYLSIACDLGYFYHILDPYNYFNYSRGLSLDEFKLNQHNFRFTIKLVGSFNLAGN